jgi:hypothetical protein
MHLARILPWLALPWIACAGDPVPPSRSADDPSSAVAPEGPAQPRSQTLRTDIAPEFVAPAADGAGHEHHGHGTPQPSGGHTGHGPPAASGPSPPSSAPAPKTEPTP